MRLFDTHNHLQAFGDHAAISKILSEASEVGVLRQVVNGTSESDWTAVAALAEVFPERVIPAFGAHPWHVSNLSDQWETLLCAWLEKFPHAAIGEIGLDRRIPGFDWEKQKKVFLAQWRLATELNRVPQLHCVAAYGHLIELLRTELIPQRGWVLHGYGGPAEMVTTFAKLGASFSFSGNFPQPRKAPAFEQTLRLIPSDRLLIETDSPNMPPPESLCRFDRPIRENGKLENHPGNLLVVAEGIAKHLGIPVEELAGLTTANAERLFPLA